MSSHAGLREAVALPAPKHSTRLILALLHPLRLGRMSRRRRILASLQAGITTVLIRPVLTPDLARQRALIRRTPRRRRVRADYRIRADCGVRRGGAVQAVRLLELVLSLPLHAVGFGFLRAVCVDRFLREVVGAAAGGDQGRPAVAVVLLVGWCGRGDRRWSCAEA